MKQVLFILNAPAFYKINLLNKLADNFEITAIILGTTQQVVTSTPFDNCKFKTIVLSNDDLDRKWTGLKRILRLRRVLKNLNYDYIVYSGWDNIDLIVGCFMTNKKRNCIISESSIFESKTKGIPGIIKKIILSRFHAAFVSGRPHENLLKKLSFKGKIYITGGVGVNDISPQLNNKENKEKKFIFIGRLIPLKNVGILIEAFNQLGKPLTIVGEGPMMEELRTLANNNICFTGFASREKIQELLKNHDCLILPSYKEPWGLVVEEALQFGLPVIASDKVGSSVDLITSYKSGVIFNPKNKMSLINAINDIENNFKAYKNNALSIDFRSRTINYISCFKNHFDK